MKRIQSFIVCFLLTWFWFTAPAQNNLSAYEYWFNNSYDNRQTFSINSAEEHYFIENIDVSVLPDGVNVLNIRHKDQNKLYSSTLSKIFYKPPVNQELCKNLTGYEMWFNNDYENRQTNSISVSTGHHSLTEVDVSALPNGVNVLNIRYKNPNNLFSSTLSKMFYKPPVNQELSENLTEYEMWFNNDYENRQTNSISVSTGHHSLTEVDVSALPNGVNVLNIRYKNENNLYSSTLSKMIYKKEQNYAGDNAVSAYKYWFDDDYENAVIVELQSPAKQISVLENLDVSHLAMGEHTINFQFQDESELWSVVSTDYVTKTALPTAAFSIIDNVACVNGPIQFVNESIDTDTWFWDFGDGTTSTAFEPEHIFTDIGDYEVSLTATYPESGMENTVTQTLTINPKYETEESVEICEGDVYTWNGLNYSTTGNYTETLASVNGCDSVVTLNLTVHPSYNSQMPSAENIMAHYPFNGNANDESGNEHHGAVDGAMLVHDRFGQPDGAYAFDGVDDYIDLGDWENGGAMSFAFWARWDAFNWYSRIIDLGNGFSSDNIVICNHQDNNNLFFSIFLGGSDTKFSATGITLNHWDFYSATVDDGGLMTLYKNGIQIGQYNGVTPNYLLRTEQYIGKSNFTRNDDEYFEGAIDEIIIYDIALTAEEIQEIYTNSRNYIPPVNLEICSSLTPYSFGTQALTESGTYTETFPTMHGCDSTVTLNLTVLPVYNHTDEVNICEGETYVFGEQTLTTSGEYTKVFESVSGCDSTVVLTLNVNPVYNQTDEATICHGETYVFGTKNLTEAGVYTEVFPSDTGCDSTVVLTLTVNPVYSHTDEVAICQGETYVFGTKNLTVAGVYTEVFPSDTGCDSTVVLTLTVNPVYNNTDEATICQGETYAFGTKNLTEAGVYTEVFPSDTGCDSTVVLTLSVNPDYNHTDEATICQGDTYVFGTQTLTDAGEYTQVFELATGCDSVVTLNLTVNPAYNISTTATVYSDELPFEFGKQSLTEAGTFSESFQSVYGCDSLVTLTLVVKPADVTPPVIVCRPILIRLNSSGHYTLKNSDIQQLTSGTTDNETNYDDLTIQVAPKTFSCIEVGTSVPVVITATDKKGNSGTANTFVEVTDLIPPRIYPVNNLVVTAPEGDCETTIDYPDIQATDNCRIKRLSLINGLGPDAVFPVGVSTERWVAVDNSGNSDTISFEITVLKNPAYPSVDSIISVEILEDSGWFTIQLTGVYDGSDCEDYTLEFLLMLTNENVLESYTLEHVPGEDTAILEALPALNAHGSSRATLTIINSETGKEFSNSFSLIILPENDAPFTFQPVGNLEIFTGDILKVFFNPENGMIFDDVDENDRLELSLAQSNEETLPEWLVFRNDSLIATPSAADTGCVELILVATDLSGEEAFSHFTLCADFPVGINLPENLGVKVFPNPTTGIVYINFSAVSGNEINVSIMDILGKEVLRKNYPAEGQIEVDLSDKVSGIYFLKLKTEDGVELISKIIVSNKK